MLLLINIIIDEQMTVSSSIERDIDMIRLYSGFLDRCKIE